MIIAPGEGASALVIADAARGAGWRVILARRTGVAERPASPKGVPPLSETNLASRDEEAIPDWNPASYVSAGALAIKASSLGPIDTLVLMSEPDEEGPSIFDGAPGSLAASLEEVTLGPIWLAREMIRRFETGKPGRILAVSVESPNEAPGVPGEGARTAFVKSAFRGFGEALFNRAQNARWKAWGIADRSGKPEALAAFAIAILDEGKEAKSGRWLPFNGKSGLFGIF